MQALKLVSIISFVAFFSSCSKDGGNSAVDSNGNCTSATISAYNRLVNRSVSTYTSRSELMSIKADCANYKNFIGGNTCKAQNLSTGQTVSIQSSTVDSVCNAASYTLAWLDNQATGTGTNIGSGSGNSGNSSSSSNYGTCSSTVINAYYDVLISTSGISETSSIADLDTAIQKCSLFKGAIGTNTCQVTKANSLTWISYSSHSATCTKVFGLKSQALKTIEINNTVVLETKESIVFKLLRRMDVNVSADSIYIYQNGLAFLPDSKFKINVSVPYCMVGAKFKTFEAGAGQFAFNAKMIPPGEELLAMYNSKEKPSEDNSINCFPAQGKFAKELTVGDLKSVFKSYATIELATK